MKYRHCTRCRRKWNVSILNEDKYYICPDCEQREKDRDKRARESAKNITRIYMSK